MKKILAILAAVVVLVAAVVIAFKSGYNRGAEETITSAELIGASGKYEIYYGNMNRIDSYIAE